MKKVVKSKTDLNQVNTYNFSIIDVIIFKFFSCFHLTSNATLHPIPVNIQYCIRIQQLVISVFSTNSMVSQQLDASQHEY